MTTFFPETANEILSLQLYWPDCDQFQHSEPKQWKVSALWIWIPSIRRFGWLQLYIGLRLWSNHLPNQHAHSLLLPRLHRYSPSIGFPQKLFGVPTLIMIYRSCLGVSLINTEWFGDQVMTSSRASWGRWVCGRWGGGCRQACQADEGGADRRLGEHGNFKFKKKLAQKSVGECSIKCIILLFRDGDCTQGVQVS